MEKKTLEGDSSKGIVGWFKDIQVRIVPTIKKGVEKRIKESGENGKKFRDEHEVQHPGRTTASMMTSTKIIFKYFIRER